MKVLFVSRLFHNVSGGVERMAIVLMNELVKRGHEVELLSWDRSEADTHYSLDARVTWHKLDMGDANEKAGWRLRLQRQRVIRQLISRARPDVMIAFQHGPFLTAAIAALGLNVPIVAAERNAPQRFDHLRVGKNRNLIFQTFRLADCITVQLDDYVAGYPSYLHDRIVSIPNPVHSATALAQPAEKAGSRRLLSVGRLSYQKNQSVLIEAFAQIARQVPEWSLVLVGAGEDETRLKQLADNTGLSERIEFIGAVKDVERFYLDSQLFCLPSRWEGFPNALAEAMAHGLPAVGFAACAGVGQLIEPGKTGLLAEGNGSVQTLANVLQTLMRDDDMRQKMGSAAAAAMARYAPEAIFDRWETTLKKLADRS